MKNNFKEIIQICIMLFVILFIAFYIFYPSIYNLIENKRGIIYRDKGGMIILDLDKFHESNLQEYERRI